MAFSKTHFQQHKVIYEACALFCYFAINATINATTVLMEDARELQPSFYAWEPFVWEYTSAFASLLIIPLIALFMRQYKWNWQSTTVSLCQYCGAAIMYSLLHVSIMVFMRELSYSITTNDYQFAGNINTLLFELFYELRKDIWSFCFFVVMIAVYRYLISQWLGDAISLTENINSDNKLSTTDTLANLLLVRKLGKEFLVKTKDIECIEASGNYANLHMKNQVYPMRITMTDFIKKGDCFGFVRTHKSFAVNINFIDFIENQPSSDAEIVMQSGKRIRLSRRYKNDFEASIANI